MKNQVDRHRSDRKFDIGDWVWLKLQPYKQQSVQNRSNQKFSQRFFGPFQVLEKIGKVAYKLALPRDSLIHDIFMFLNSRSFMASCLLLLIFLLGCMGNLVLGFSSLWASLTKGLLRSIIKQWFDI